MVTIMTRRHGYGYYSFWRGFRQYVERKLVRPHTTKPYLATTGVFTETAPVLRVHMRAINDLVEFYEALRILQEFVVAASEALRVYIVDVLGYDELRNELIEISRAIAHRFNRIIQNDKILGIIIGTHGGRHPSGDRHKDRKLKPLGDIYVLEDNIELRTLELGVDIILQPSKIVNKILRNINHTKIYWTRL